MKADETKSTILIISMGFLFLHFMLSWQWAIYASFIIGVIGIIPPFLSNKIVWGWMKLSKLLGYIVPNILLSLVFFLLLFPISVIYKLFNKDQLMLSNKYKTYFIDKDKEYDKKSFERTW